MFPPVEAKTMVLALTDDAGEVAVTIPAPPVAFKKKVFPNAVPPEFEPVRVILPDAFVSTMNTLPVLAVVPVLAFIVEAFV